VKSICKDFNQKIGAPIGYTSVVLEAADQAHRFRETNLGNFIADSIRNSSDFEPDFVFITGGTYRLTDNISIG
jgi:2',3'-cyclic-nucleotide 2'-phosphodiesterase (5'-nucleotidase family)